MADDLGVQVSITAEEAHTRIPGYIKSTDYATGYLSRHTQDMVYKESLTSELDTTALLRHVNCAYLSTPEVPPTLLALKQHAQALCILIQQLCPSTATVIDGRLHRSALGWDLKLPAPEHAPDKADGPDGHGYMDPFAEHQAFDFLDDLTKPYDNDDEWHLRPLNSLINSVRAQTDHAAPEYHCALAEFDKIVPRKYGEQRRPYATHHSLLMHANTCLEMLDHEYSASGGILSLLPADTDRDDATLEAARNSLVGQWLFFTQHLVARQHELEIAYANALDLLGGEAVVPHHVLAQLGPEHVAGGRHIAYPQDRWILANAGDDVFNHLHRLLDRADAELASQDRRARNSHVVGRTENTDGRVKWHHSGLVSIDVSTRYFRLRDGGGGGGGGNRGPLFVMPAREVHPGAAATRQAEARPTVVALAKPTWPARVSDWETRNREALDDATSKDLVIGGLVRDKAARETQLSLLRNEVDRANFAVKKYESLYGKAELEQVQALTEELHRYRNKLAELKRTLPEEHLPLLAMDP